MDGLLSSPQTKALITAVRDAARAEIVPRFRSLPPSDIHSKSAPDDLVTAADTGMETRLTKALAEIYPDALVLGEEATAEDVTVMERVRQPGQCIIIDPVDGTWNFAQGVTTFGTIIAVTHDGDTVLGMLYDPMMDDWMIAGKDAGAWYVRPGAEPTRLRTSQPAPIGDLTGIGSLALYPRVRQVAVAQRFPDFRRVLGLRCACHEYRLLAAGSVSFMMNGALKPWDHAAGALVVKEAGGVARLLDGSDYMPTMQNGLMLAASDEDTWGRVRDHFGPAFGLT
jgi:fructose-1,6-bisphosphatase/inositol monophosphatase family enzyme